MPHTMTFVLILSVIYSLQNLELLYQSLLYFAYYQQRTCLDLKVSQINLCNEFNTTLLKLQRTCNRIDYYITYILFFQIVATDADRNDVISYSIENGNSDVAFQINATSGEISTTSFVLDFETTPAYYLLVRATDNAVNARQANTLATITLIDVNDNTPIFGQF